MDLADELNLPNASTGGYWTESRCNSEIRKVLEHVEALKTPVPLGRGHREKRARTWGDEEEDLDLDVDSDKQAKKKLKTVRNVAANRKAQEILKKAKKDLSLNLNGTQCQPKRTFTFKRAGAEKPSQQACPGGSCGDCEVLKEELRAAKSALQEAEEEVAAMKEKLLALEGLPAVVTRLTSVVEALQRAPVPLHTSTPVSPVKNSSSQPSTPQAARKVVGNSATPIRTNVAAGCQPGTSQQSPKTPSVTNASTPRVAVARVAIGPNTSVSKAAYSVINWNDGRKAAKDIAVAVFGRSTLAVSSLTGCSSNAHRGQQAKPQLDPAKVQDIIDHILSKIDNIDPPTIRKAITSKCNDEGKNLKRRQ